MSSCNENQSCQPGASIASVLNRLGPRTVEGDQGRYVGYSIDEAIRADDYERKACAARSKKNIRAVLRTIGGHRLLSHDGRAS